MSSDTHGWFAKAVDAGVLTAKKADPERWRDPSPRQWHPRRLLWVSAASKKRWGIVFVLALVLISLRKYPAGVPLVSTCSAAISAACHQPLPGNKNTCLFPLLWGEVSEDTSGIGHCCFTTARDVKPPTAGKFYD